MRGHSLISNVHWFPYPMGVAGERPQFDIKRSLGHPLLIPRRGYLLKFLPQGDIPARQRGFEISIFPPIGELPKSIEPHHTVCRIPVPAIPVAIRSQQIVFAYDLISIPHRSYRVSGGLPRREPRIRHRWICLQLSGDVAGQRRRQDTWYCCQ